MRFPSVSILVLVDAALRPLRLPALLSLRNRVSILVLVDAALRPCLHILAALETSEVSILVLVDAALRLYNVLILC